MFSIAICRHTGDKWESKTLFLLIFDPRSSIVDNVFDCRLPGVNPVKAWFLVNSWQCIQTKEAYFHFWWQHWVESNIHANYVPRYVVKPTGMSLGLRIRSKVNWVQDNTNIDKHTFLCDLLTIWYQLNSLKQARIYVCSMFSFTLLYVQSSIAISS